MATKNKIAGFLSQGLQRLEEYLDDFTRGLEGMMEKSVANTLLAGGKRIRPALFFISARNNNYDLDYLIPAAASIEIIHTASLIHDDIIDRSALRRGKQTIHNLYNNDTAKYVGNYLFTHTFSLLNTYNRPDIMKEMSSAAEYLVRGEFDQLKTNQQLDQGEEYYFDMINKKTSALFRASCVLGGLLSNSRAKTVEGLARFGQLLGVAFQINDDLLDIDMGKNEDIGKPVGNDLRQGNVTLPLIYALQDEDFRREALNILPSKPLGEREIEKILELMSQTRAAEITREKCKTYIQEAQKAVDSIGGRQRKKNLLKVLGYFKL